MKCILMLFILIFSCVSLFAQESAKESKVEYRVEYKNALNTKNLIWGIGSIPVGFFMWDFIQEGSAAGLADLLGAKNVGFRPWPGKSKKSKFDEKFVMGEYWYDEGSISQKKALAVDLVSSFGVQFAFSTVTTAFFMAKPELLKSPQGMATLVILGVAPNISNIYNASFSCDECDRFADITGKNQWLLRGPIIGSAIAELIVQGFLIKKALTKKVEIRVPVGGDQKVTISPKISGKMVGIEVHGTLPYYWHK